MEKTAIQIAIENIDQSLNLEDVKGMLGILLELEKQQMFDYIKTNYVNGEKSLKFHQEEFEKYYNETFKSE